MRESADKLLQELSSVAVPTPPAGPAEPQATSPESARALDVDRWRILLVDIAYLLNACYRDVQYWDGIKTEKDTFRQFGKALHQLTEMPNAAKTLCMTRAAPAAGRRAERANYEIRFGATSVDSSSIGAVIRRQGIRLKHLEGRLQKAYETFAAEGIEALVVTIPDGSPESLESLQVALRVLSRYRQAAEKNASIPFLRNGSPVSMNVVRDENGQPDPNLTLLAAVNGLQVESLEAIVRKVSAHLQQPDALRRRRQLPSTYHALFAVKSLSARLQRPPIEINGGRRIELKPAAADSDWSGGVDSRGVEGSGPASEPAGPVETPASSARPAVAESVLLAGLARGISEAFPDSPDEADCALRSLDGEDYPQIDAAAFGKRLGLLNRLIGAMQTNPAGQPLVEAALQRIQSGMEKLPADLLADIVVQGDVVKTWDGTQEKVIGRVTDQLAGVIDQTKDRAAAGHKPPKLGDEEPLYLSRNISALAEYFDVPLEDMEAILKIFLSCFDQRGNFQKTIFEKQVPGLARFHKKIFFVLWEFLKDMPRRGDRLPFLNSLQLMIKELKQPIQAIRILLTDFTADTVLVPFPDRNAIMLVIQFLRTYSKEISVDIELTPEEILMVKAGLDPKVVNYAAWKVNGDQKRFLSKVITIRKNVQAAFDGGLARGQSMPARFLLALEREVHIFLALTGGDIAGSILHSALGLYGNPTSAFYGTEESLPHLGALLQHVSVLIRALGRVGAEGDLVLLDQIRQHEEEFARMSSDPRHAALVRRVFGWIDPAKQAITARG